MNSNQSSILTNDYLTIRKAAKVYNIHIHALHLMLENNKIEAHLFNQQIHLKVRDLENLFQNNQN